MATRRVSRTRWSSLLLQLLVDEVPVDDVPPLVDVLLQQIKERPSEQPSAPRGMTIAAYGAAVLVVEVVGVLPDVEGEEGLHAEGDGGLGV